MAEGATKFAWQNSRAKNGSLLVLLAIADECGEGEFTEMKISDLALKTRLSDKAVRDAVKNLAALGELSVAGGRGAVGRFAVGQTSAESTDVRRQNLPTSEPTSVKTTDVQRRQNLPTLPEKPQVKASSVKSTDVEIPDALDFGSVVSGKRSKPKDMSGASRPDVDRLCEHLARTVTERGCKPPLIGKRWRDAARLMIDKDGRTEQQVHDAIDWSAGHHFWHRNILSMEKLREKYDRLRLDAIAEQKSGSPASGGRQESNLDVVGRLMQRAAQMEGGN